MKKSWVWYAALVVACGYGTGRADVKLPNVFSDHAVLQRDEKLPVWGKADPNEKIVVSLAGQTAETTADAAGQWRVVLKPLPAGGPFDLVVTGHNTITRHDILIGEVWLCVGQSNMATSLAGTPYWMKECPAADDADIRFLTVGDGNGGAAAAEPQGDIADTWQRCSPLSAFSFSAIGYFAGQEIHRRLQVPVGLIKAASWGSPAEPFVSREALATATNFAPLLRKLELDTTAYLKTKDKFDADYAAKAKDYEARKEALAKAGVGIEKVGGVLQEFRRHDRLFQAVTGPPSDRLRRRGTLVCRQGDAGHIGKGMGEEGKTRQSIGLRQGQITNHQIDMMLGQNVDGRLFLLCREDVDLLLPLLEETDHGFQFYRFIFNDDNCFHLQSG